MKAFDNIKVVASGDYLNITSHDFTNLGDINDKLTFVNGTINVLTELDLNNYFITNVTSIEIGDGGFRFQSTKLQYSHDSITWEDINFLNLDGGTMAGDINMANHSITNVSTINDLISFSSNQVTITNTLEFTNGGVKWTDVLDAPSPLTSILVHEQTTAALSWIITHTFSNNKSIIVQVTDSSGNVRLPNNINTQNTSDTIKIDWSIATAGLSQLWGN